ncbi:hypothetical protein [Streptomyces sp. NRRL F-2664]|uniref:hypothetical protein n=1 Tax=Streptomyces sp. NRRL F-2664 TaxID=1463842 RepID=UPI00131DA5D6|nr:hypothetical protein [Streptomyces sp. NRRL F-2664]
MAALSVAVGPVAAAQAAQPASIATFQDSEKGAADRLSVDEMMQIARKEVEQKRPEMTRLFLIGAGQGDVVSNPSEFKSWSFLFDSPENEQNELTWEVIVDSETGEVTHSGRNLKYDYAAISKYPLPVSLEQAYELAGKIPVRYLEISKKVSNSDSPNAEPYYIFHGEGASVKVNAITGEVS